MKLIIDKGKNMNVKLQLEEYIPLKVVIEDIEEPVNYFSYSKGKKSLLEFAVGAKSEKIKKITLLMSAEYTITNNTIGIDSELCECANIIIEDYGNMECEEFSTYLFEDGIKISLSTEHIDRYIQIDNLYVGISRTNLINEICVMKLSKDELNHIKTELEYQ